MSCFASISKKFILAKKNNINSVEVWGTGNVKREFLNVEDLAEAIYFLVKKSKL